MCTRAVTLLAMSFALALASFSSGPARAQIIPAKPAVQEIAAKPIGKIVTATGSVTIEHVTAVVIQANVSDQSGHAKVGELVYQGDVVQTGADGRVGINFSDVASSGLHSNGYSLVRRVVASAGWQLDRQVDDFGRTLGEELLEPTRIYTRPLLELIAADGVDVHALSHVTGGGLAANLARVLPTGMFARVEREEDIDPWKVRRQNLLFYWADDSLEPFEVRFSLTNRSS